MSEARFDRIDQRLDGLDARFDDVDQRLDAIDTRFNGVDQRFDALGQQMRVLHEEVIARIAAIPEYWGATKSEVAELRESTEHRLDPLEASVRHHSAEIERLKHGQA